MVPGSRRNASALRYLRRRSSILGVKTVVLARLSVPEMFIGDLQEQEAVARRDPCGTAGHRTNDFSGQYQMYQAYDFRLFSGLILFLSE